MIVELMMALNAAVDARYMHPMIRTTKKFAVSAHTGTWRVGCIWDSGPDKMIPLSRAIAQSICPAVCCIAMAAKQMTNSSKTTNTAAAVSLRVACRHSS